MATIVEMINPLTGLPEQVDKLDHTAQEIDDAVGRSLPGAAIDASIQAKPNPNLLDNWYFGNPVNQRGQASYTGAVYGLDRWKATNDNTTVLISDGFIALSGNGAVPYIRQTLDNPSQLLGKAVTLSALLQDGTLKSATSILPSSFPSANTLYCNIADVADLLVTSSYISVQIKAKSGGSNNIVAVKLELGSQQTLAHQDADGNWVLNEISDYGEQLARCQRYFRREKNNTTTRLVFGIGLPVSTSNLMLVKQLGRPMRAYPAVSVSAASDFLYCSSALSSGVAATAVARGGVFVPNDIVAINLSGTFTVGTPYIVAVEPGGYMDFNAEL